MHMAKLTGLRCCGPSEDCHFAPLCASQLMRDDTKAVIQGRDAEETKTKLQDTVSTVVSPETSLGSASFCVTLWNRMSDLMDEMKQDRPVEGFISCGDGVLLKAREEDANDVWKQTVNALSEMCLKIDQAKLGYTRGQDTEWQHKALTRKKDMVVLGMGKSERNKMKMEKNCSTLARGRQRVARELAWRRMQGLRAYARGQLQTSKKTDIQAQTIAASSMNLRESGTRKCTRNRL